MQHERAGCYAFMQNRKMLRRRPHQHGFERGRVLKILDADAVSNGGIVGAWMAFIADGRGRGGACNINRALPGDVGAGAVPDRIDARGPMPTAFYARLLEVRNCMWLLV
ncbi:MAG: hypothetical protein AB7O04_00200 [Hyphomonadaceae bacterium]